MSFHGNSVCRPECKVSSITSRLIRIEGHIWGEPGASADGIIDTDWRIIVWTPA